MQTLSGKTAVITGGTSGVGLGIARAFAEAGMRIVLAYRHRDRLEAALGYVRSVPGADVAAVHMDVADRSSVARAAEEVRETIGRVHILCNSAGVNLFKPMDLCTYDDWDWIMGVNLNGVVNCIVSFLPGMKAHAEGGHIVNVASMASFIPGAGTGIYTASKFAVRGLSESLRLSLGPQKIGVSLVCPGLTRTNIWQSGLRRPGAERDAVTEDEQRWMERWSELNSFGMDPLEVGRRTVEGIRQNRQYILSHPEFKEELDEIHAEIIASLPDIAADPKRLVVENGRRDAKRRDRDLSDRL